MNYEQLREAMRMMGSKGGKTAAANMTAKARRERAAKAAAAREVKRAAKKK